MSINNNIHSPDGNLQENQPPADSSSDGNATWLANNTYQELLFLAYTTAWQPNHVYTPGSYPKVTQRPQSSRRAGWAVLRQSVSHD